MSTGKASHLSQVLILKTENWQTNRCIRLAEIDNWMYLTPYNFIYLVRFSSLSPFLVWRISSESPAGLVNQLHNRVSCPCPNWLGDISGWVSVNHSFQRESNEVSFHCPHLPISHAVLYPMQVHPTSRKFPSCHRSTCCAGLMLAFRKARIATVFLLFIVTNVRWCHHCLLLFNLLLIWLILLRDELLLRTDR